MLILTLKDRKKIVYFLTKPEF